MNKDDLPDVMTAAEVALYVRTTPGNLAQDRYLGRGIPFVKHGRRVRYRRDDVLAYLDENRCTSTSRPRNATA